MSANYEIFLRPTVGDADLLRDLGTVLGARPVPHTDGGEGFVVGYDDAWVDVYLTHDLVDDAGLRFSAYPWYLTVRAPGRDKTYALALARRVYRLLVDTGRYDAFIVWNDTVPVAPDG